MTSKIDKELAKYTAAERLLVQEILQKLLAGDLLGLQITKLKGHDDIFRIRKGRLRIIYRQTEAGNMVLAIERRSEKTYRNF